MKKNIFAVLLIAVMAFSFSACGKGKEESKAPEKKTEQTDTTKDTTVQNAEVDAEEEKSENSEEKKETEFIDTYDFEKKVDELNTPGISEERKEELLAEIQAILEQVEKNQQ